MVVSEKTSIEFVERRGLRKRARGRLFASFLFIAWLSVPAARADSLSSTWPQPYSVQRHDADGTISLRVPYYTITQDLKRGGAISSIRLTHGATSNLLLRPLVARVVDANGEMFSDLLDDAPRVTVDKNQLNPSVMVEGELKNARGASLGISVKTIYSYHWGYIRIHREFAVTDGQVSALEVCPAAMTVETNLSSFGYRDGLMEADGAPPFSYGACHWGRVRNEAQPAVESSFAPRYLMLADPGVEGLEWFASSDLSQWDRQINGRRGQAKFVLGAATNSAGGIAFSVSPFSNPRAAVILPGRLVFDFYIGLPLLEGHAFKPWFHTSFNRNRGKWVTAEEIKDWAATGIQDVHCHNDGDFYGDGLFWRDGVYPPYPDMDKYDDVITECHKAGIRVTTYFSNKELNPGAKVFQEHGSEWARMDQGGHLQHNAYNAKSEYGAQMCLRSGWLDYFKRSVDRVLSRHKLDGVYYDWNVALLCLNPQHEQRRAGQPAAGHWDIDELLDLMEWTRRRVGPHGLIIVHDTGAPMFATENFADDVVAHEWGYSKWTGRGPDLSDLPLEWSLVGARPRGVISYGMVDANAASLHRLFAVEALLSGVTPWPASPEAEALYPILNSIKGIPSCRFADWRNRAVTLGAPRFGAAIYSRLREAWIVIGNLDESARQVSVKLHPDKLPFPLASVGAAKIVPWHKENHPLLDISPEELTAGGVSVNVPGQGAVLIHVTHDQ